MIHVATYIREVLKGVEDAIPPPANCHHSLHYAQYGSDEDGWQDKLALSVCVAGKWHTIFLDDGDMFMRKEDLVVDIVKAVERSVERSGSNAVAS